MKRKIRDGWHTIASCRVYVEDGYIKKGITREDGLCQNIYRACLKKCNAPGESGYCIGGWCLVDKITPDAFRAGIRRGTIDFF